jgi:hypothetical protein
MNNAFLEKLAYIMVIIMCFCVLCTLFIYLTCILIRRQQNQRQKRRKKPSDSGQFSSEESTEMDEQDQIQNDRQNLTKMCCGLKANISTQYEKNETRPSSLMTAARKKPTFYTHHDILKTDSVVMSKGASTSVVHAKKTSLTDLPDLDVVKMMAQSETNGLGTFTSFFNGFKTYFYGSPDTNPNLNSNSIDIKSTFPTETLVRRFFSFLDWFNSNNSSF